MIYLELFSAFFLIGAFTFGGGYAMIALIRDTALVHGWLTEGELLEMIAVAESTPGPIAVNMATFVGAEEGGILGAAVATLGVVLPSFIVILLIAALARRFLENRFSRAFLSGVRPTVVGLILSTALTMLLSQLFGITSVAATPLPDLRAILIFAALLGLDFLSRGIRKKRLSPISIILASALFGLFVYALT
jgi:chromate transporter